MKRLTVLVAAAAIATTTVAAGPAAADPSFSLRSSGAPITDGDTGQAGQVVEYLVAGCSQPGGGSAYFGQFVTTVSQEGSVTEQKETATEPDGSFSTQTIVPLLDASIDMDVNWYCAQAPVISMTDPSIMWLSPTLRYTIEGQPGAQLALGARSSSARTSTAASKPARASRSTEPAGAITSSVDPDALPLIDRMGIEGRYAAKIKERVDARVRTTNTVENLLRRLLRLKPAAPTNRDYVEAAFQVTHGRVPSASVLRPQIARLDAGELRVTVLEDIALQARPASFWNR